MSTRAAILLPTGTMWKSGVFRASVESTFAVTHIAAFGRYHHSDGYPNGLGVSLIEAYVEGFAGRRVNNAGFLRMVKTLVFDHPAGWSTINGADWSLEPGFGKGGIVLDDEDEHEPLKRATNRPQCYCHGDRSDEGGTLVCVNEGHTYCLGDGCQPEDIAWAYRLTPEGLEVWEAVSFQGTWRHQYRQTVSWIVPNPRQVMARIQAIGQEEE